QIPSIANDLLPLVSTNMTNSEILSISSKVLGMGINNISQARFPLDEHHTIEWTDMYHMIIDIPKTTEEIHKFIYSK
ncbi:MAG: LCP family protein, partial [Clostridium sp.]